MVNWIPKDRAILEFVLLSLVWLAFTAVIIRDYWRGMAPSWELMAMWATLLWGISAIEPGEIIRRMLSGGRNEGKRD